MGKKPNSKDIMLPHSQAKVRFYKTYLDIYLRVLCNAPFIKEINIYDVFCGRGIYANGGKGSPIEAADVIKDVWKDFRHSKHINLHINDKNSNHVNAVRKYIQGKNSQPIDNFVPLYSAIDGEVFLERLGAELKSSPSSTRNLVFIDPYGYKEIKKDVIQNLLANERTEVMIFLPISFMNRFTSHALSHEEIAMYKPLVDFVKSFFPSSHPIVKGEQISNLEYIAYLTKALQFNDKYYSTSYHIERSTNNYFALFFITPNEYGYEKILETKWKLDEKDGNGFNLPQPPSIFDAIEREENKNQMFNQLKGLTIGFLKEIPRTNIDLYKFALSKEYLPKHMNEVLKELLGKHMIDVTQIKNTKPCKKGCFYLKRTEGERILITIK